MNNPDLSRQLMAGYFRDELDAAQLSELDALLRADPESMREFAELLAVSEQLHANDWNELSDSTKSVGIGGQLPLDKNHSRARISPSAWLIAASVLVAAGVFLLDRWSTQTDPRIKDRARQLAVAESSDADEKVKESHLRNRSDRVVAYLGHTADCRWVGPALEEGTQFLVGTQLQLTHGVAEVIFDNGARVTARGPCVLSMDDAQACSLARGTASVYVPESAFGFKVVTPSGIVVDLGTEFGIAVNETGGAEVHVFQGEVAFQPLNEQGGHFEKSVRLLAAQACEYSVGGTSLREFEANEAAFAWRNRPGLSGDEVPNLTVREDLALWLAADRFVDVDDTGRVLRWSDLVIDDNTIAEDALQLKPAHRPRLVEDALNGMPAVRFEDGEFLLTPPLSTTNEQTAFVVLKLNKRSPKFQSVLNYNGPPQRIVGPLGGTVAPSVFEICLRDSDNDNKLGIFGEVFTGYKSGGKEHAIRSFVSMGNRLSRGSKAVAAFRYSLSSQRMSLFVNGRERSTEPATAQIAITSRKIIGRHPIFEDQRGVFGGDLAEVLIYNRALDDGEVLEVSDYLMQRYAFHADTPAAKE